MSQEQITQETVPVAETTQTTTETQTPISSTTGQPTVAKSWKEAISEEFRSDPNIAKFTEIDALAKSYINATRMIGSDKVIVPNQNSNEDHWNEVYDKLGRPQSPDKYKFEIKSDVVPFEETSIKQFAENAHKLGLNNKQAQGILEFYKNNVEQSAKQSEINIKTAQEQSQQQLRQEWGRAYDEKLNKAKSIAQANFSKELLNTQLNDGTILGDNPEIIKGFANIANLLSEDKIISTESESVNQGRDIQTEISKIMDDKSGPYWNKSHPDHSKMVQQMFTLREMLNGK